LRKGEAVESEGRTKGEGSDDRRGINATIRLFEDYAKGGSKKSEYGEEDKTQDWPEIDAREGKIPS